MATCLYSLLEWLLQSANTQIIQQQKAYVEEDQIYCNMCFAGHSNVESLSSSLLKIKNHWPTWSVSTLMEVTKLYGKLSGLLSKGLNHEKLSFRMLERGDCVGVILLY